MPDSRSNRSTDPRVFRVYCVNGNDPQRPFYELRFSDSDDADPRIVLVDQSAPPDGSYFVVEAYLAPVDLPREQGERYLKLFDSVTGREFFSIATPFRVQVRSFRFPIQSRASIGQTIAILLDRENELRTVVRVPSGEIRRPIALVGDKTAVMENEYEMNSKGTVALEGKNFHFVANDRIQASIKMDELAGHHGFSTSGDYWIGSTKTGTVRVYDSNRIRRELTQLRLGW